MISIANIKDIPSLNPVFLLDDTIIESEIETIKASSFSVKNPAKILSLIFSCIDLTSLEGNDTNTKIKTLCNKVLAINKDNEIPSVAAICVYPSFAKLVSEKLKNSNIHTASVAGAFPSGQSSIDVKLKEIKWAIEQGAQEIDMVISRGKLIEGNYQAVFDEIVAIKKCCKDIHLKVILESGELENVKNIRIASDLAMYAGADFIKTSTGKIDEGATPSAVYIMLQAIKDFYTATGKKVGIKPAGGISTEETAVNYLKLVEQTVGESWLNNKLFRFGASRLANTILNQLSLELNKPQLLNYF